MKKVLSKGLLSQLICKVSAVTFIGLYLAAPASATIVKDQKGLEWASKRDLTSAQFSAAFTEYTNEGYMMIDVDAYPTSSGLRYAMVWRENTDRRGWAEHRNLSSSEYGAKWTEYKNKGYRPLDIAAYTNGSQLQFAGIWVQNKENINWSSHRNLTSAQYGTLYSEKRAAGYRLVDMEAYQTSSGLRYSAIWYENTENKTWVQYRNMSRDSYQNKVNELSDQGYAVVDFESYQSDSATLYAAIFEKKPGYSTQVRTERDEKGFANLWRQYRDQGYRLVDFERYSTSNGDRYGGVWVENDSRLRYSKKTQIDDVIQDYLELNDLPGVSVSVVKDGQTIYRRGFGYADLASGKWAHSRTIYSAASVSKVIGGTLAAKLEQQQQLRNGASFSLDLSRPTRDYVDNIPAYHSHTVEQLLSHAGCIGHYGTTPAIPNQTVHYPSATQAVESIDDYKLVTGCTIGDDYSYSTPGMTFVAAVLEGATERSIHYLLQSELFSPYGLSDTRVQYSSANLPSNYERAIPYNSNNTPSQYSDNSWKVLGGGIETSAYDLSQFGWKVLSGQIVSADTRDNRLWKKVDSSVSSAGLAWFIKSVGGKRVAEHNGSVTGARSFIRIYRDDGLVVAIMSNRTDHNAKDVGTLTNEIANIVL